MQLLDPHDPIFRRPIVRLLTTILPILWSLVEFFVFHAPLWGLLFLAAGLYAGYMLYIVRQRPPHDKEPGDKESGDKE